MSVASWSELLLLLAVTMVGAVAGPLTVLLAGVWLHAAIALEHSIEEFLIFDWILSAPAAV